MVVLFCFLQPFFRFRKALCHFAYVQEHFLYVRIIIQSAKGFYKLQEGILLLLLLKGHLIMLLKQFLQNILL